MATYSRAFPEKIHSSFISKILEEVLYRKMVAEQDLTTAWMLSAPRSRSFLVHPYTSAIKPHYEKSS
jgi:hypothetical protein